MSNSVLGLDIGTSHIKAVSLEYIKDHNPKLVHYAIAPSQQLASKLESGEDSDIESVSEFLIKFLEEQGFTDTKVVGVLPEHKVFSKVISMPHLKGREFKEAIEWEAQQHIPNSLSE